MENSSEEDLKKKFKDFFPRLLPKIRMEQVDLFTSLDGIHFLPVDKTVYLKVQSFINGIENHFPEIQCTTFLFHEYLVWSGLDQDSMRVLYSFFSMFGIHQSSETLGPVTFASLSK
jgi:hypothetical protein